MSWSDLLIVPSILISNLSLQIMIEKVMSIPGAHKPDHIIYDSCCLVKQQAQGNPWFADIGMCVDPWHLENKHKTTHKYCRINCNPKDYPELLTGQQPRYWTE